ncbi:TetR/AcrR family transcriptional regulator [Lysinibacillus piscis]|uniref:TetR/AcrR family transcriptional regulator n=1 Tax=Lysinibacillus piscis TaxID=2518931 RepID=A0ABQ5NMN3_9BACI|nr:TetR/AcrR family transcriptional regulator [Lysinibacillus sp. KH24]GLC89610.1 TetR/AcrR family transcriptional regulator [Lysinibacillus sp. KH24]
MEKTDRRILKSKKAIQCTFLSMLIEDGFDEITVKEITEIADISRKTFYLHYVDKYDLLDTIVTQRLQELEVICEQKKEAGFIEGTIIWFDYFAQHKAFFLALFTSKSTVAFRERLLDFMMKQLGEKITERDDKILLRFVSTAVLGIMESFVLNQLNGNTEEIATKVGELMLKTIKEI